MIGTIVFFLELFLSIIGVSIIFIKLLGGRVSIKRILLLIIALIVPIYFILIKNNQYLISSTIITYMYSLVAVRNIDWKKRIYVMILFQALSIALTSSSIMIVKGFINSENINYILDIVVNGMLVLCLIIIPKKLFTEKIKNILLFTSKGIKIYIVVSLYCLAFTAMIISFLPQTSSYNIWYLLIFIFATILIVVALIFPLLISNNISKNYYKRINYIEDEQIKIQSGYYKNLLENNLELRRFKHDYKNQLIALQSYLDNNDIELAKKYIRTSSEYINKLESYHTGNYILDALLDDKNRKAHEHNALIEFSGNLFTSSLDDADLCIIFGNAIDNAIEACEKLKSDRQKTISIIVNQPKHLLSISVSNPVSESPEIEDNMIVTSKDDTTNHGFGLYSIKRTVKKYNGDLNISCVNGIFSMKICLSI